jgi:tape measure domain-containing protein
VGETLSYDILARDSFMATLTKFGEAIDRNTRQLERFGAQAKVTSRETDQAEQKLGQFGNRARETSNHLDGLAGGLQRGLGALKSFGMGAAFAFGAVGVAAAAMGVKTAAGNEQAQISFEVLLGSQQKAAAFLKQIQDFAAKTPFDMPGLRDAASRLLAVGVNAKDVIPIMTRLGDATSGMGTGAEGVSRAVLALTQIKTSGVVHGQDVLQLTEAGIPALDALATHFKTTVAQIRKDMEAGKIKPDDLFAAIEAGEGPAFTRLKGMMDKQSTSLVGLWSTFKDDLGQTLATAFQPAVPALKKVLDFGAKAVPEVLDGIRHFGHEIGDVFKGSTVGKDIFASLEKAGRETLPFVKRAFDDVVKTLRDNREGLEKFGHMLANDIIPALKVFAEIIIVSVVGGFNMTVTAVAHFVDAWNAARAVVVGAARVMFDTIVGGLGAIVHGAALAFGWIPGIGDKLKDADKAFQGFVDDVNRKLDDLAGKPHYVQVYGVFHGPDIAPLSQGSKGNIAPHKFAVGGGDARPGDIVRVGENGPETLVFGPRGAGTVVPNGGGGGEILVRVQVEYPDGRIVHQQVERHINSGGGKTAWRTLVGALT